MLKRSRETESFTVSFLDVASCGFGAMIILLMLAKPSQPAPIEEAEATPTAVIAELQEALFEIRGETRVVNRDLNAKQEQLSALKDRVARLRRDLSDVQGEFQSSRQLSQERTEEIGKLSQAQQRFTEEMRRLDARSQEAFAEATGGIPVDSEYIVFVIDTSGSMFNTPSWGKMLSFIRNALEIYPSVLGIQVLNCEGTYLLDSYRGKWIPDTPQFRERIISSLLYWNPTCNSNPVPGITVAIDNLYSPDKKISIYYIGDDFNSDEQISYVLEAIDRKNIKDSVGERRVRIHGVMLPGTISERPERYRNSIYKYLALMRELTSRNGGTFVSLNID
jgi:hypothetical protein